MQRDLTLWRDALSWNYDGPIRPPRSLPRVIASQAVRRFKAILVAIAMLAAPLALLARGVFCDPAECNCAVMCPMHASHPQSQPMCGSARHATSAPMCGVHQGHHALDYGFISPFAPGVPLAHAQLAVPVASSELIAQSAQFSVDGIFSTPFEPPRS